MSSSTTGSSSSSASLSLSHACAFLGKPGSFAPTTSSSDSEESTAQSSGKQRGKKQPRRKTTGCPDARVQAFVLENLAKGTLKHDAGAGEDFFFLVSPSGFAAPGAARADAPSGASTRLVLGIADGVGGWQDQGIDPSAFSQALMYHAAQHAASLPETSTKGDLARAVMQRAFDDTLRMDAVKAGSSTALVASVDAIERTLQVANLGDSTFMLLRRPEPALAPHADEIDHELNDEKNGGAAPAAAELPAPEVVHVEPSQQHYFNCPLQLAKLPPRTSGSASDKPSAAAVHRREIRAGDMLVFCTDGLSDNVFPREVAQLARLVRTDAARVELGLPTEDDPTREEAVCGALARMLVQYARAMMGRQDRASPFTKEAWRQMGIKDEKEASKRGQDALSWLGGKVDDVTVLVVSVHGENGREKLRAKL